MATKNQVTIPVGTLPDAGMKAGDVLRAEADGAGRVVLTRVDEVLARYSGALETDGRLGDAVGGSREERSRRPARKGTVGGEPEASLDTFRCQRTKTVH